jgi:hypothetical protein
MTRFFLNASTFQRHFDVLRKIGFYTRDSTHAVPLAPSAEHTLLIVLNLGERSRW